VTSGKLSTTTSSFDVIPATVSVIGKVFLDLNAAGSFVPRVPGMAGRVVFIDLHGDGVLHPDDPQAVTDASGNYAIPGVAPGSYTLRVKIYPNDDPTGSNDGHLSLAVASGSDITWANFGLQPGSTVVRRTPSPIPFAGGSTAFEAVVESLCRRFPRPGK
jgi:hypothetical protein